MAINKRTAKRIRKIILLAKRDYFDISNGLDLSIEHTFPSFWDASIYIRTFQYLEFPPGAHGRVMVKAREGSETQITYFTTEGYYDKLRSW